MNSENMFLTGKILISLGFCLIVFGLSSSILITSGSFMGCGCAMIIDSVIDYIKTREMEKKTQ